MPGLDLPVESDRDSLAEYIEALMLIYGHERMSAAEIGQQFPSGQRPSDAEISYATALIAERASDLEHSYPYALDDEGAVVRAETGGQVYDFLLLLSLEQTPLRRNKEFTRSDPLFDAVVAEALKGYLGPPSYAVIFGAPARGDRPKNFSEAVSWVGNLLGVEDLNRETRLDEYKDAGVDVIAWKPFKDKKYGFTTFLVQNTVRLEFAAKAKDVIPSQWMEWLRLGKEPSVAFAVPFSISPDDSRWNQINYSADVPFDRGRIVEHVSQAPTELVGLLNAFNKEETDAIRDGAREEPQVVPRVPKPRRSKRNRQRMKK